MLIKYVVNSIGCSKSREKQLFKVKLKKCYHSEVAVPVVVVVVLCIRTVLIYSGWVQ